MTSGSLTFPTALLSLLLALAACGAPLDEAGKTSLLDEADTALAAGRLEEAEASFARVLKADPASARAATGLGLARLRQGRPEEAVSSFQEAARLEPKSPDPRYLMAVALGEAGKPKEAIAAFQALVSEHPDHRLAASSLIVELQKAGRQEEAREAAAQAADRWPRRHDLTMQAARAYRQDGDPATALRYYTMSLMAHPYSPDALSGVVASLRALGRTAEAEALAPQELPLRRTQGTLDALALEAAARPDDPEASRHYIQLLFEQGRFDQAIAHSEVYMRQFPEEDFGGALAVRAAQASTYLGDAPSARRFLTHAEKGNRSVAERTATAEVHAALGDFEAAFAVFEVLLLDHPNDPSVLLGLGRMAMRTGRLERAEPALRRAASLNPGNAAVPAALGLLLAKKQDDAGATAAFSRALAIDPHQADAHFGLGFLAHKRRRLKVAEASLRQALVGDPDHATARAVLAMTLADEGKCEEAIPLFTRALVTDFQNQSLHAGLIRCYEETGHTVEAEAARRVAREVIGAGS